MRVWLVVSILVLSAAAADAETPSPRIGLVTCESWLSNPAYQRDGEIWIYGFWDGLVQGLGISGRIGQIPNLDLMLDDVRRNCKNKPAETARWSKAKVTGRDDDCAGADQQSSNDHRWLGGSACPIQIC
jgi:hypothetical protein